MGQIEIGACRNPSCGARLVFYTRGHLIRKLHTVALEVIDIANN